MWYDELGAGRSWSSLWSNYVLCGTCTGIRRLDGGCSGCGLPMTSTPGNPMTTFQLQEGKKVDVVTTVFAGGEGRYQDWVYLKMLERGWTRPLSEADRFMDVAESSRPSARAEVAVTFWTYFETRIERLMRQAMCDLPEAVMEDLLRRYSSIGSRLDRLYGLLFDATYWQDLGELGFEPVSRCLQRLHQRRNEFAHGHPEAIDDALVTDLVNSLKDEHEAWIAVFNKRTARLHTS